MFFGRAATIWVGGCAPCSVESPLMAVAYFDLSLVELDHGHRNDGRD